MAKRTSKMSAKVAKQTATKRSAAKPALLSGGNPQIANADGDNPVQAYIAATPGWKQGVGRRLDVRLSCGPSPTWQGNQVELALLWFAPPRRAGAGDRARVATGDSPWRAGSSAFIASQNTSKWLFRGTSLRPIPPGKSKQKEVRYLDVHVEDPPRQEDDQLDEAQFAAWVKQGEPTARRTNVSGQCEAGTSGYHRSQARIKTDGRPTPLLGDSSLFVSLSS